MMHASYLIVLLACSSIVVALVVLRVAELLRHGRPHWGRLLNEWIWTVVPLAVLAILVFRALKVGK